jgi:hypothetical protein
MKTLKSFAVLCIMLSFATIAVNAQTISTKYVSNIPRIVVIPCVPERALGTFTMHTVIHFNKDGFVTKRHSQPMGGVLIGQVTGTVYRATGVAQTIVQDINSNGAWTTTYLNIYHIVGQGGIQLRVHVLRHETINANGEVTAEIDNTTSVCE